MVYKKYIKKDGKIYGPYIYHSRRVNGKVISEYRGTGTKVDYKKFIFIFFAVIFFAGLTYGIVSNWTRITGNIVLDSDANYQATQEARELEGILNISLSQGEFIPASSKLSFETSKGNYTEYKLENLLDEETTKGYYYILGKTISGNGSGYGIPGEKKIYPFVQFTLAIYSESEEPIEENIIQGEVSAENPFTYELEENQTAEIISSSQAVNMTIEESIITVTTDYFENEMGFGHGYVGDDKKILYIDLSELNLILEGNTKVSLIYSGEEIISLGTLEQEESKMTETVEESEDENLTEIDESENANQSEEIEIEKTLPLTNEEKQILINEFGSETVGTKVSLFKDRIIVRYEFGGMWIENSYDSDLSKEELEEQMQDDRIRWLRDIINRILEEETQEQELEGFEETISI